MEARERVLRVMQQKEAKALGVTSMRVAATVHVVGDKSLHSEGGATSAARLQQESIITATSDQALSQFLAAQHHSSSLAPTPSVQAMVAPSFNDEQAQLATPMASHDASRGGVAALTVPRLHSAAARATAHVVSTPVTHRDPHHSHTFLTDDTPAAPWSQPATARSRNSPSATPTHRSPKNSRRTTMESPTGQGWRQPMTAAEREELDLLLGGIGIVRARSRSPSYSRRRGGRGAKQRAAGQSQREKRKPPAGAGAAAAAAASSGRPPIASVTLPSSGGASSMAAVTDSSRLGKTYLYPSVLPAVRPVRSVLARRSEEWEAALGSQRHAAHERAESLAQVGEAQLGGSNSSGHSRSQQRNALHIGDMGSRLADELGSTLSVARLSVPPTARIVAELIDTSVTSVGPAALPGADPALEAAYLEASQAASRHTSHNTTPLRSRARTPGSSRARSGNATPSGEGRTSVTEWSGGHARAASATLVHAAMTERASMEYNQAMVDTAGAGEGVAPSIIDTELGAGSSATAGGEPTPQAAAGRAGTPVEAMAALESHDPAVSAASPGGVADWRGQQ